MGRKSKKGKSKISTKKKNIKAKKKIPKKALKKALKCIIESQYNSSSSSSSDTSQDSDSSSDDDHQSPTPSSPPPHPHPSSPSPQEQQSSPRAQPENNKEEPSDGDIDELLEEEDKKGGGDEGLDQIMNDIEKKCAPHPPSPVLPLPDNPPPNPSQPSSPILPSGIEPNPDDPHSSPPIPRASTPVSQPQRADSGDGGDGDRADSGDGGDGDNQHIGQPQWNSENHAEPSLSVRTPPPNGASPHRGPPAPHQCRAGWTPPHRPISTNRPSARPTRRPSTPVRVVHLVSSSDDEDEISFHIQPNARTLDTSPAQSPRRRGSPAPKRRCVNRSPNENAPGPSRPTPPNEPVAGPSRSTPPNEPVAGPSRSAPPPRPLRQPQPLLSLPRNVTATARDVHGQTRFVYDSRATPFAVARQLLSKELYNRIDWDIERAIRAMRRISICIPFQNGSCGSPHSPHFGAAEGGRGRLFHHGCLLCFLSGGIVCPHPLSNCEFAEARDPFGPSPDLDP